MEDNSEDDLLQDDSDTSSLTSEETGRIELDICICDMLNRSRPAAQSHPRRIQHWHKRTASLVSVPTWERFLARKRRRISVLGRIQDISKTARKIRCHTVCDHIISGRIQGQMRKQNLSYSDPDLSTVYNHNPVVNKSQNSNILVLENINTAAQTSPSFSLDVEDLFLPRAPQGNSQPQAKSGSHEDLSKISLKRNYSELNDDNILSIVDRKEFILTSLNERTTFCMNNRFKENRDEIFVYKQSLKAYSKMFDHYGLVKYNLRPNGKVLDSDFDFTFEQMKFSPFVYHFNDILRDSSKRRWMRGSEYNRVIQSAQLYKCHNLDMIMPLTEKYKNYYVNDIMGEQITFNGSNGFCSLKLDGVSHCIEMQGKHLDHKIILSESLCGEDAFLLINYQERNIGGELRLVGAHHKCDVMDSQNRELRPFLEDCIYRKITGNAFFNAWIDNETTHLMVDTKNYSKFEMSLRGDQKGFCIPDTLNVCSLGSKILELRDQIIVTEDYSHILPNTPFEEFMIQNFEVKWITLISFSTPVLHTFFKVFKLAQPHHKITWEQAHLTYQKIKERSYGKFYYLIKQDIHYKIIVKLDIDYLLKPRYFLNALTPITPVPVY